MNCLFCVDSALATAIAAAGGVSAFIAFVTAILLTIGVRVHIQRQRE